MGTFVNSPKSNSKRNILGKKETEQIYLQFIPGIVIDVVTSYKSAPYVKNRDINAIIAKSHVGADVKYSSVVGTKYYPLLRGTVDVPMKGDPVLLCDIGGINYYLGPLNTLNNPNFNLDHLNVSDLNLSKGKSNERQSQSDKLKISKNFVIEPVSRLQKLYNEDLDNPDGTRKAYRDLHGDMLFEGRHGNSIRIGSRSKNPYIIFSNGRVPSNIFESTNDGTVFAMFNYGTIHEHFFTDSKIEEGSEDDPNIINSPFVLGSDDREEAKRIIGGKGVDASGKFDYNYNKNQTLLTSDKITINSRKDNCTISSKNNTILGSGNEIHLISENFTTIESSNIYLGKDAEKNKNEPLVLGTKLNEWLKDLVHVLMKTHALMNGVPLPVTDIAAAPLAPQLQVLMNKLTAPEFWSEYHYIEDNGQKS